MNGAPGTSKAEGNRKRERARLRRQCYKLAARLGCTLECERNYPDLSDVTIWIIPPNIYYGTDGRPDPFEGDHSRGDWEEVWESLKEYEADLFWDRFGIAGKQAEEIVSACVSPTAQSMLEEWMDEDDCDTALVLADWLDERGHELCAALIRQGVALTQTAEKLASLAAAVVEATFHDD